MEESYKGQLLEGNLFKIRILCILLTVIRLCFVLYYYFSGSKPYTPEKIFYIESFILVIISTIFLLTTGYFLKKNKQNMLWFNCYLFMSYYVLFNILNLFFIQLDSTFLFQFLLTLFLFLFVADFKPKIFLSFSVVFYLASVLILVYQRSSFHLEGIQEHIFFTFFAILLIKLIYHNSKTKVFINSSKIHEMNNNLEEMVRNKTKTVLELKNTVMETMAELVESRDHTTGGHIVRTSRCLQILINTMLEKGLYKKITDSWNIEQMILSAQLHDVGKIAIDDIILRKPDKLTKDEYKKMKTHTILGGEIIKRIQKKTGEKEFLDYAYIFTVYHHEKWDGSGYPFGINGEKIPLPARLMALIDVYDALISERPYKKPFSHEEAVKIIIDGSGSHFDPILIELFVSVSDKLKGL